MQEPKDKKLKEAWTHFSNFYDQETPKQIKKSLFVIQQQLLLSHQHLEDRKGEPFEAAIFHLELLYNFMDEMDTSTIVIN